MKRKSVNAVIEAIECLPFVQKQPSGYSYWCPPEWNDYRAGFEQGEQFAEVYISTTKHHPDLAGMNILRLIFDDMGKCSNDPATAGFLSRLGQALAHPV